MPSKKKRQRGRAPPSKAELRFHAASLSYVRPGDPGLAPNLRPFSVKLNVVEANEVLTVPDCYRDLTMRSMKNRLELLAGIPVNFQRLQYLDEVDLDDNSTFKMNDIIPGGTITMRIWQEDAWARLVSTAAKGNFIGVGWMAFVIMWIPIAETAVAGDVVLLLRTPIGLRKMLSALNLYCKKEGLEISFQKTKIMAFSRRPKIRTWRIEGQLIEQLQGLGATMRSPFRTAHAARLKPEALKDWLAHRAFVALFITAHRGHLPAVEFLLENGADVQLRTPLGRTALHVAATSGQLDCIKCLLNYGARATDEDYEKHNATVLARLWGQKESERKIFRFQWKMRRAPSSSQRPPKSRSEGIVKT